MSQFESVNDYISFMKAHPNMTCPIKHTLDIIGGKWKLLLCYSCLVLSSCVSASYRRIFRELRIQFSPDVSGIWRGTVFFFDTSSMKFRPMWSILSQRKAGHFQVYCWLLLTGEWRIKHEYFLNAKRTCEKLTRPLFINFILSDY